MALSNFDETSITIADGVTIVAALHDDPITDGDVADSSELKAKFDEGVSKLKTWINGTLIPFVNKKANQFRDTVTIAASDWMSSGYTRTVGGVVVTTSVYKATKTLSYSGASAPWVESGVCLVVPKSTVADVAKMKDCCIYGSAVVVRSGTWGKSSYTANVSLTLYTTTQLDESVDVEVFIVF